MIHREGHLPLQPASGSPGAAEPALDPAGSEAQWREAARSLGLDEAPQPLLEPEAKAAIARQVQALIEAQDHAAAVDLAWLLVYSDPWDRDATLDLALCLQHLGELESACRFYGIALVIDATDAYCLYRIGECLESLGDLEQARDAYRAAIELSRQDPAYAEVAQQAQRQLDTLT